MVEEKIKKPTFTMGEFQTIFYEIIHSTNDECEEKRFRDLEDARKFARETRGQIVKTTKRTVETMEMELVR